MRADSCDAHFLVDVLEGSGGTSTNMNANEVIANLAAAQSGRPPGKYAFVHPNDHVNLGQSTNDVIPAALKLAIFRSSGEAIGAVLRLAEAIAKTTHEFGNLLRLGRTCLQDAQPMTLGQRFGGYEAVLRRHADQRSTLRQDFLVVPLGGTAIGTGLGARAGYKEAVLRHLSDFAGAEVTPADDPFDGMQNMDASARFSVELRNTANTLWKAANDLIVLSSGPADGIGDISLPAVQAGSSMMPERSIR